MPIFGPERYRFALAAGGVVLRDRSVLLVHSAEGDGDDFWVLPGGGLEEGESLSECAEREVREETGLDVRSDRLLYIEQFIEDQGQSAKLWFLCSERRSREIDVTGAGPEPIVEAHFLSREEMVGKTVYPPLMKDEFWEELDAGFPEARVLPPVDLRTR